VKDTYIQNQIVTGIPKEQDVSDQKEIVPAFHPWFHCSTSWISFINSIPCTKRSTRAKSNKNLLNPKKESNIKRIIFIVASYF
jgi:hypothetical protein